MIIENGSWSVYVHINKITNKPYVGVTSSKNPCTRWGSGGINYRGCQKIYHAIQKYGWDSFEHYIIAHNLTKEEASNMEQLLIQKLDSIDNGYNIEPGGVDQGPRSEQAIIKLREARLRQVITPEQYAKGAAKRRGVKRSPETVQNVTNALRDSVGRPVICIETNEWFRSCADAAEKYGLYSSNVAASAQRYEQGKERRKRGLHWKFASKKPDGYPIMGVEPSGSKRHASQADEDIA